MTCLSDKIKLICRAYRFKYEDFAEKLGVSRAYIAAVAAGHRRGTRYIQRIQPQIDSLFPTAKKKYIYSLALKGIQFCISSFSRFVKQPVYVSINDKKISLQELLVFYQNAVQQDNPPDPDPLTYCFVWFCPELTAEKKYLHILFKKQDPSEYSYSANNMHFTVSHFHCRLSLFVVHKSQIIFELAWHELLSAILYVLTQQLHIAKIVKESENNEKIENIIVKEILFQGEIAAQVSGVLFDYIVEKNFLVSFCM